MTSLSSSQSLQDGTGVGSSSLIYETNYPTLVGADQLQQRGHHRPGRDDRDAGLRSLAGPDPELRRRASSRRVDVDQRRHGPVTGDPYGHGTHVTSIAAGGAQNLSRSYLGIAPKANLVIVRAFDGQGARPLHRRDRRHQLDRREQGEDTTSAS